MRYSIILSLFFLGVSSKVVKESSSVSYPHYSHGYGAVDRCLKEHNLDQGSLQVKLDQSSNRTLYLNEKEKNCMLACTFIEFVESLMEGGPGKTFNVAALSADLSLDEKSKMLKADSECRLEVGTEICKYFDCFKRRTDIVPTKKSPPQQITA